MKTGKALVCGFMIFSMISGLMTGCTSSETVRAKDYAIIDLHLHLDGSISLESARELAEIQGITLPESDAELQKLLQVDEDCQSLNEYLEKFDLTAALLQTKEAISTCVYNLERELQALGLLYAEIRFAPQFHDWNGLTQVEVVEAAIEGMNRCDFKSNLILCCMRGEDVHEKNMETVRVAKEFLGRGVACIDLAGAEALYPSSDYEAVFRYAAELGVPFTIHAGEADGPESVYTVLDFGTKRVGHGVRSHEDEALVKRLAEEGIVLELCPTSNLHTKTVPSLAEFPLTEYLEAGVKVTVNSDNMVVSHTDVGQELQMLADEFGLTAEQLYTLTKNAIDASFADDETKAFLYSELEKRAGK